MVSEINSYVCDVCGDMYLEASEAKHCEEIGRIKPKINSGAVFLSYREACNNTLTKQKNTSNKNSLSFIYRNFVNHKDLSKNTINRNELGVYVFLYNKGWKDSLKYDRDFTGHFPELVFHEIGVQDPPLKKQRIYFAHGADYHDGLILNDKQLRNLEEISLKEFEFISPFLIESYKQFIQGDLAAYEKYRGLRIHRGLKTNISSKFQNLKLSLGIAVDNEEFEEAAEIRDKIKAEEEKSKLAKRKD